MAEFTDSLIRFDSIHLDVNENPSTAENTFSDINEIIKTVPEISPKCDLYSSEVLQFSENPSSTKNDSFADINEVIKTVPELSPKCDAYSSEVLESSTNPLKTENDSFVDVSEINKTVPPKAETSPKCDLYSSEILQSSRNPSNTVNNFFSDINEINKSSPPKCDISSKCDFNSSKIWSSENPNNCNENVNQMDGNKFDAQLQNVDEHNNQCSLAFNDTLHSSQSSNNYTEMPEMTDKMLNNKLEVLPSDVKESNLNNRNSDSGIHDSENNIIEDSNVIDFTEADFNISNDCGGMITDFNNEENDVQVKDDEFHDAVQFFKDPSSFTFLENAGSTSAPAESLMMRSSLYMNFDPLHAKFYSQSSKSNELQGITEDDVEHEICSNKAQDIVPDIVNKHLPNVSPRESLRNVLISFDSPVTSKDNNSQHVENSEPQKLYTEEEMQQALKIQELSMQETFLKKQQELELARSQKQEEMEAKLKERNDLCKVFHSLLKEMTDFTLALSEKEKALHKKLEVAENEKDKLKEDLKTSTEDLQSVESTFSDFHKRYEQCKSMLKVYTQNEDNFKRQLESMKVQLQEKEEMYKALQSRTEEMLDKANTEVANVKKAGDAQVAVLKAQLKKAELKISSLESDVKHVKIENGKLSNICDELMAKVSEA